jgi:hypothetical protein
VLDRDRFATHDPEVNRREDGRGEKGNDGRKSEELDEVIDKDEDDEDGTATSEEDPEQLQPAQGALFGNSEEAGGGCKGTGISVDTGERGAQHGDEGSRQNDRLRPGPDAGGIKAYQLPGKTDSAGRETFPRPRHDERTEGQKGHRQHDGHSVAQMEINIAFLAGGPVLRLFLTGEHPEGGPGRQVNGGRHPAHEHDEEGKGAQGEGTRGGPICWRDGPFAQGQHHGHKGQEGKQADDPLGQLVEELVMADEDNQGTGSNEEGGQVGEGDPAQSVALQEGRAEHGDPGNVDHAGEDINEEEEPDGPAALCAVALQKRLACGHCIALTVEKKGILEKVDEEEQTQKLPSVKGACACRPDQMGPADGRTGNKQAGSQGFAERSIHKRSGLCRVRFFSTDLKSLVTAFVPTLVDMAVLQLGGRSFANGNHFDLKLKVHSGKGMVEVHGHRVAIHPGDDCWLRTLGR